MSEIWSLNAYPELVKQSLTSINMESCIVYFWYIMLMYASICRLQVHQYLATQHKLLKFRHEKRNVAFKHTPWVTIKSGKMLKKLQVTEHL
jgi:hypothetical protein